MHGREFVENEMDDEGIKLCAEKFLRKPTKKENPVKTGFQRGDTYFVLRQGSSAGGWRSGRPRSEM